MTTAHITGLKELLEGLRKLPMKVAKNVARRATYAGATVIRDAARRAVPKKRGVLARAIKAKRGRGGKFYATAMAGVKRKSKGSIGKEKTKWVALKGFRGGGALRRAHKGKWGKGRYANDPFYAHMVHGGTRGHTITGRGGGTILGRGYRHPVREVWHKGARAQPFMDRAFRSRKMAAVKTIQAKLREGIMKEARSLGHR